MDRLKDEADDEQRTRDLIKLFVWIGSYVMVLVVMVVMWFKYKKEKRQMEEELSNFDEIET